MSSVSDQITRLLRGSTNVVSKEELEKKLSKGKPLRVKLGVDPTSPDIHLGHTVALRKLRAFQELGHHVVFIIGDFTASIGDPSGRDSTRPPLNAQIIEENTKTYKDQVFHILDPKKTEIRYNSEWLLPLFDKDNPHFLPKSLLRNHTVQQLMEREDFSERKKAGQPITLLELLYPLFQGYDSVAIKADVELGGNDQLFNLLMGREMQKDVGQEPQVVLTMPLLVGLDGVQKMSKSYNNHIGVKEPANQIFAKVMSISDESMWKYYELLTEEPLDQVKKLHPMEAKKRLGVLIAAQFQGKIEAEAARAEFDRVFSNKETPTDIEDFKIGTGEMDVIDLLVKTELVASKNEARRLLEQGGVQLDGKKIEFGQKIKIAVPTVLKVGKRRFKKLIPG